MTIAAGIDVGTGAVKAALFEVENGEETWLSRYDAAHPAARSDGAGPKTPSTRC